MTSTDALSTVFQDKTRRQKRSQIATLILMGAAPIAILALDPLHQEVQVFEDVNACQSAFLHDASYCQALQTAAATRHETMAPSYASKALCEADFAHVTDSSCQTGWCSDTAISGCEIGSDGQFHPQFSAFMVQQSLITAAMNGTPLPIDNLTEQQLQPVYGMPEAALSQDGSGDPQRSYYGPMPFLWHYVTPGGQYLGDNRLKRPVTLSRMQLASATGKTITGETRRGGFGTTAKKSMASARSMGS